MKISRRTLLRGFGGIAIALPGLEIMRGGVHRAAADVPGAPKRFICMYGGVSTGAYGSDMITPVNVGPGYDLKRSLASVAELGMQSEISVVTGLKVPWAGTGPVPPGGRRNPFHGNTVVPQLCGFANGNTTQDRLEEPRGPTCDQVVAKAIGMNSKFPSLTLRAHVNGDWPVTAGRISWKSNGAGGVQAIDPTLSPKQALDSLFTGFGASNPADEAKAKFLLKQRTSALDLTQESIKSLIPRLGSADKIRMERHLDEIRALEQRLSSTSVATASCKVTTGPDDSTYPTSQGYDGEDQRADLLADVIKLAFACDMTRVASFQLTFWKSYLYAAFIPGCPVIDMHELGHGGGSHENHADSVGWHVKKFTMLAKKLKDAKEVDGTSILDHTAMALTFEGGYGYDPEGGGTGGPHSTENMTMVVAGGAGGLKRGQHISAPGKHPANVFITAMEAVGVPGPLGEVSGNISALVG